MPSVEWAWIGSNDVQSKPHNRVIVPKEAVTLNITTPDRPLVWGNNSETNEVVISKLMRGFNKENTPYRYNDSVKLQKSRLSTIPLQFMWDDTKKESSEEAVSAEAVAAETESTEVSSTDASPQEKDAAFTGRNVLESPLPEELRFHYGETLHFITGKPLMKYNLCYVLKDEEGRQMVDESLLEAMTDGGWNVLESDVDEVTNPEEYVDEDEVLILNSGDVISVEELRDQWAEEIPEYIPENDEPTTSILEERATQLLVEIAMGENNSTTHHRRKAWKKIKNRAAEGDKVALECIKKVANGERNAGSRHQKDATEFLEQLS